MIILPTITTVTKNGWKEKIKEVNKLGLEEICLFPTALPSKEERLELYSSLKSSSIKSIPFVHLRSDMEDDEIDFFINDFGTELFNIHSEKSIHGHYGIYGKYADMVCVENNVKEFTARELSFYAGICLDVSHLESIRRTHKEVYKSLVGDVKDNPVLCWHVSAIRKACYFDESIGEQWCAYHNFNDLKDFDYVKKYKKYSKKALVVAIEVENSLEDQLKAKEYIEKMLK